MNIYCGVILERGAYTIFGLEIPYSIIWIIVAVIFGLIEAFTLGLTTIWFALGALVAMLSALLHFQLIYQILIFLVASAVLVYYTRPIAKQHLKIGATKTNVSSLIGKIGVVTQRIVPFNTGQVKVSGQIWTAKSLDNEEIVKDTKVEIIKIEGVKLIVKKIEDN